MNDSPLELVATDGQTLCGYKVLPADQPAKAVIQIAHGASEHSARYLRVAAALSTAGYGVYMIDHRGHGRTASDFGTFGIARPGGWTAIVRDQHELSQLIAANHPDTPIILFGHSMGSMIAQCYLQQWGEDLAACVLSGTTGGLGLDDATLQFIAQMGDGDQADEPSEVFAAMFAGFNEPFTSATASGFEWLSRDAAEVQAYVDDPWCGQPLSNSFVADMLVAMSKAWLPENEANIRTDLPTHLVSGEQDPVGGENASSVRELAARYEALGATTITMQLYTDGRHEMLNEINRSEVEADLLAWLNALEL